jgi:dTDP-4-amino-4,6-dideoxygalactose transaminase
VLDSQHFILGPEVEALEASLAALTKSHFAIGVSSGTDALLVALLALGVGPGDEVITTPFSFFATAGVISRLGARPVFVDIDRATFTMSPTGLEDAMTERTKAVLPVHLFGQTAAMEEILTITRSRGIAVVEDAAQALGASYDGSPAGSLGTLGCFSFFPTKNLGAYGDGGLVTTNDAALAERVRSLRTHGQTARYVHEAIGGNFRLDALQAAVLRAKLPFFDRWTATRRRYASLYLRELGGCTRVVLPVEAPRCLHVYHQFVLRSDDRDGLRAFLASRGIASEVYYPVPLHLQPCFRDLGAGAFPESERAAREVLALPIVPELTEAEVLRVARTVLEYLGT